MRRLGEWLIAEHVAWFLAALAALYTVTYLAHPALPGRPNAPLGWWSWFDQGEYIKSARAISAGDFASANHLYPPAYPLLGAIFVRWMPVHPFFVIDLTCFIVYAAAFVAFASMAVGSRWAMALFAFAVPLQYAPIFQHFVVPWTTIPVAAIVAVLAWIVARRRSGPVPAAIVGTLAGAIAPFRPIDMLLALPLVAAFLGTTAAGTRGLPVGLRRVRVVRDAMIVAATAAVGPLALVAWNLRVHGSLLGKYGNYVASFGFSIAALPHKLTSLFLDSAPLHLEPHAAILERFPWIALAAIGIALTWLEGWSVAAAVGVSMVAQVLCYSAYSDLTPHGLWRYGNIHYFVWGFPYLALFAFTAASKLRERRSRRTFALVTAVAGLMASVTFARREIPATISARETAEGSHVVDVALPQGQRVSAIDVGWNGPYYETNRFHVVVDGKEISAASDFRLLPADSGLRVLFLHPMTASRVTMTVEPVFRAVGRPLPVSAALYDLTFGIPRWPGRWVKGLWSPAPWY